MAQALKGKFPVFLKAAFELRYRQGYTYLDRCGRTINLIQDYYPEWILAGKAAANPQGAPMIQVKTGSKFNFSSTRVEFELDRRAEEGDLDSSRLMTFATEVEELTSIVIDQLGLADFSRIGARVWYLLPAETEAEANLYLKSLGLHEISPSIAAAFKGELESSSFTATVAAADRNFRISADTVERTVEVDLGDQTVNVPVHLLSSKDKNREKTLIAQMQREARRQKHPLWATAIDIDSYVQEPAILKPGEFLRTSVELSLKCVRAAVEQAVR